MSFRCHLANNFDDTFCCHCTSEPESPSHPDMSRPQSMPDFAALMESSMSQAVFESSSSNFEKRIHSHSRRQTSPERKPQNMRKKPSISLAAGLMMNTDTPPATGSLSPRKRSQSRPAQEKRVEMEEGGNLFYAYAQRVSDANCTVCLRPANNGVLICAIERLSCISSIHPHLRLGRRLHAMVEPGPAGIYVVVATEPAVFRGQERRHGAHNGRPQVL